MVLDGFRLVFTNRMAILYATAGIFMFGALVGFINTGPADLCRHLRSGRLFPRRLRRLGGVMALSTFLNSRIVGRFGMRRLSHFALLVFISARPACWFVVSLVATPPLWLFFTLFGIIMFHFGWVGGNMNSLSMEPLGNVAGTASSVFGFLQTVGGALLGLSSARASTAPSRPVAGGYAADGPPGARLRAVAENGRLFGVGSEHRTDQRPEPVS